MVEQQFTRWRQAEARLRPQLLLRDPDLANARDLDARWGDELDPDVRAFIAQSHRVSRKRQRLAAAAAVVFGIVALAATGFGLLAYQAQQQAGRARARALEFTCHVRQAGPPSAADCSSVRAGNCARQDGACVRPLASSLAISLARACAIINARTPRAPTV